MLVLNFHGVGRPTRELDDGEQDVWLGRTQFDDILDSIKHRDDVQLTFDDGNSSDVDEALPALILNGKRACFFICAGRLSSGGFLDRAGIRELCLAGMSVCSHGMDHVPWRKLSEAELRREITHAKQVIEDATGAAVDSAACPFGAYDRHSLAALREADFKRVYTSDRGPADAQDWLVARNTVHSWDSPESIRCLLESWSGTVPMAHKAKRWVKQWR
jgi:peptidoglycan/xylan/chitin deacetylase (PgdA/CDA1 family)